LQSHGKRAANNARREPSQNMRNKKIEKSHKKILNKIEKVSIKISNDQILALLKDDEWRYEKNS